MSAQKQYSGVVHLFPLIIIALLLTSAVAIGPQKILEKIRPTPIPTPTPSEMPTPTSIPTSAPTPTITSSPKPSVTPTPTPVATAKPTSAPVSGPPSSGYSRITVATEKGNFIASVISIDLNGARMITDTTSDNDCGNDCPLLPLGDFVSRNGGFAGVNGTYFCPATYPECESKKILLIFLFITHVLENG